MLKCGMRTVYSTLTLLLFLAALGFAIKNSQEVTLQYYLGVAWHAPLALMLLVSVCIGAMLGLIASLSLVVRERRRRIAIEKELRSLQSKTE